jgi:hypothetical protein
MLGSKGTHEMLWSFCESHVRGLITSDPDMTIPTPAWLGNLITLTSNDPEYSLQIHIL